MQPQVLAGQGLEQPEPVTGQDPLHLKHPARRPRCIEGPGAQAGVQGVA